MASLRKQEKRKHMGYDSTSFEPSNCVEETIAIRGKHPQERETSGMITATTEIDENLMRDDIAYATGRTAVQPFASRDLDLPAARELKDKIRDIKRLLNRADHLPADVKIEKERALVGYERDLEIVESRKNRAAMIKKYHFNEKQRLAN
ncbi:hypothetical protein ACJ72_04758 [Emergomyces africanus]|uniref:rRNA-processing protein EFG1 n=1 Tax=Emergomyces africanus TaxID=1955775 RepID=A0A1B7NVW1_9EURO|nr:hypothetical protein ACJ72_04758 [Emergomyces africanus]